MLQIKGTNQFHPHTALPERKATGSLPTLVLTCGSSNVKYYQKGNKL